MSSIPPELGITEDNYKQMVDETMPRPPLWRNSAIAFLSGGVTCLLGQFIKNLYVSLGFSTIEAANPTVATMILLAALLTGFGLYDRIARWTGAGTAIPVTGFANSMTAAAMEFKKEGLVLGVGAKMFSLAGTVIVFGVVTAFVAGLISAIL